MPEWQRNQNNKYIIEGRNKRLDERGVDEEAIYRDSWRIADPGAVNPVAVAATLREASSALLHYIGTDGVRRHPALRLMAAQLASLYNVNADGGGGLDGNDNEFIDAVKSYIDKIDENKIAEHVRHYPKLPHDSKVRHLQEHGDTQNMTIQLTTAGLDRRHTELHESGNHGV